MGLKRFLFIAGILTSFSTAQAADRYWVAAGSSGTWSATSSWSATPTGASGATVPGIGDQAIFDSKKATPCFLTSAVTVSSITLSTDTVAGNAFAGYVDTSTNTLTVRLNFTLNNGTFYARTSSITVQGNWAVGTAGKFIANTSSVTFSSAGTGNTIDSGNSAFYKLIFSNAAGGWTTVNNPVTVSSFTTMLGGSLTVANSSMTNAGDFQVTAGSTLTINNDLEVDGGSLMAYSGGIFTANSTATLRMSGTGNLGGGGTGRLVLPNLSLLVGGGGQTTTLGSSVTLLGDMANAANHTLSVSAGNPAMTVGGNWLNSGTFVARSGSVTFNSSSNETITTNNSAFYNLLFNNSAGSWTLGANAVTASSDVFVQGGTFIIAGSSLTAGGSLRVTTPGTVNINNDMWVAGSSITNTGTITSLSTPTVTMSGAGNLGGTGTTILPGLSLAVAAKTTTLAGNISILGAFNNVATHVFDTSASNFSITISSAWVNSGTFTARSSSVTFTGAGTNVPITTSNSAFYNLLFNGAGSWVQASGPITASSDVFVQGGTFTIAVASFTTVGSLRVTTPGTVNIDYDMLVLGSSITNTGTILSLSTPLVTMNGAGTLGGTGSTTLPALTLVTALKTTTLIGNVSILGAFNNPANHTLDASANNYSITISSNWVNAGIYTAHLSSVTFVGSVPNGTITTGGKAFYNVGFDGGVWTMQDAMNIVSSVTLAGGTLNTKANNWPITVGGEWLYTSGSFVTNSSSISFGGSGSGLRIQSGDQPLWRLAFTGSGHWVTDSYALTVTSTVFVNAGTLQVAGGSTMTVVGNPFVAVGATLDIEADMGIGTTPIGAALNNLGTVTSFSTATLTMSGTGILGGTGRTVLPIISLNGAATTTTLAGGVTLLSDMNNASGHTLDASASNFPITAGGSWFNSGTYVARSGSVTFNSSSNETVAANNSAFYNLVFNNGSGSWATVSGPITTSSDVFVQNGTLMITGSSFTATGSLRVTTPGTVNINNDMLVLGSSITNTGTITSLTSATVTMSGAGTLGGTGTTTLPILTVTGAGKTTTLAGAVVLVGSATIATGHTLDVSASNYQITVSSWFANNGTFTSRSGTVVVDSTATFTGATSFFNFSSTVPGLDLTFQGTSTTTVTGTLTLTGASGNPIQLHSTVPGQNWLLTVSGSSAVSWVDAQDSDARGGTTIVPTNGTDSGNNHNWNFGPGTMRTWWGAVNTVWSNNSNWDSIAPGPTEKALIVSTATRMPTLTGNVAISTLSIVAASSVTLNGFTLTLSSFSNAGLLVFKGNETVVPAPDNILGSTIIYNSTSGTVPVLSTWTYANLQINGAGGKFLPTGDLTVSQALTVTAGTFMTIASTDTITFVGTSGTNGITTNNNPLYNVTFNGSGGTWVLEDSMTVISSITLNAGTLNSNTGTALNGLAVGREWINGGGTFITNSSSVTFTGTGTNSRIQSGDDQFYKLIFTGSGKWVTDSYALTVTSTVLVNAGTLQVTGGSSMTVTGNPAVAAGATLDIEGDMGVGTTAIGGALNNAGTITGFSTATLTLNGTGNLGGTGNSHLPGLTLNGNGFTTTLVSGITLLGDLNNTGTHVLDVSASNYPITASNSWFNSGTFTARAGSVTFNSSSNETVTTTNSDFYNLVFNGAGSWVPGTGPITVSSDVFVQNGTFQIAGSSLTAVGSLRVTTPGTVNINNDVWVAGSSITNTGTITSLSTPTVTMSGAGTLGGTGSTTLPGLTLAVANKATTLAGPVTLLSDLTNPANHTLDVSASNYPITAGGSWFNSGIFNARAGSTTFNSSSNETITTTNSDFYNLLFNGAGSWAPSAGPITVSSDVFVQNGTFMIAGSSLTATGSLRVTTPGTANIYEDMLVNGSSITNTGTITSLATATVTMAGAGTLGGTGVTTLPILTLTGAKTTTLAGPVIFIGSTTIGTGHTLDVSASNYQITVSSWFANNGTFTSRSGTVVVDSTATFTGATSFFNFSSTVAGLDLTFQGTSTTTVTGTLTLTGASGNPIQLHSTVPGQNWLLTVSGSSAVSWVDAQDSDARGGTTIVPTNGTDSGNNHNWNFGPGTMRTWWGAVNTVWSNNSNWDSVAPGPTEKALIVSTATRMPTLTGNVAISTLSIVAASSVTLNGFTLTLSSFSNAGLLVFKGNETVVPAPDNILGSTIIYNSTSGTVPVLSTWTYANLQINGAGGKFLPTGDLTINQALTVTAGTFMTIASTDTITFVGTSGTNGITTNNNPLYNVTFNGSGGTWVLEDSMTVISSITLNAGTLNSNTGTALNGLAVGREWINGGGTFITNSSSVTFTGTGTNSRIQSGDDQFYKLIFTGSGKWVTDSYALTVTSTVLVNAGTLQVAGGSSMTVTGNPAVAAGATLDIEGDMGVGTTAIGGALNNAGTITGFSTATLTLNGTGNLGGTGISHLPGLTLSGNGFTTTLVSGITLLGNLNNGGTHTLDVSASNFPITIGGSWTNSGTFKAQGGSVTFNSSTLNQTIMTTGQDFYNLLFNGTGSWTSLTGPVTASSDVFVQGGTFAIANSSLTAVGSLRVTTPGTVNINNDVWVAGSSITNTGTITSLSTPTVTMSGAGTLGGTGSTTLPALTLATAQTTTLAGTISILGAFTNPATHTLDASASNYGITISSNWANSGIYTARSSSVTFTGSVPNGTIATNVYAFYNLSVNGGAWQNITNTVTASSSLYVSGGTLSVRGSSLTVTGGAYVSGTGILSVNHDVLISGGDLANSGSGSITGLSTPTITLNGTGTLGGSATTTLPMILTLGNAGTTTLGGAIVLAGSTTITGSHTLDVSASNYQITVSSWFANNGTFTSRSGTVVVNSTATFTGSTSFYTFSSTVAGLTLTFQNTSTTTVTNALTLTSVSGNPIRLRSTTPGQNWSLAASGSPSVSWVDVQDSDARSGSSILDTNGTDSGHNRNWNFGVGILRTWWGSADTVWSNNSNWDSVAPGPTEAALIVSTATRMPTLTGNVAISTVSIVATSSLTLNGFTLTLSSFTNAGLLVLKGNEAVAPAPLNVLGSTVVYNATSGTLPILSTWTYANLQINGAGGKFLPNGNLTINQALTVTAGTFMAVASTDTITFVGTSGTNGITTANNPLYNVTFNGAGGTWVLQDSMTVISSMTLNAGTLNSNTATATNGLAIGGEWINGGGVFLTNSSSVTFTGSGTNLRIQSGDDQFYKLIFTGSGKWVTDTYALTVTSTVLVNAGTLQVAGGSSMTVTANPFVASGATLDIEGDMGILGGSLNNAGTITGFSTATLTMTGTGNVGGTGSMTLPGLTLVGNAQTTTLFSAIGLKGTMTNPANHTLDVSASNFPITTAGSWANSGTFKAQGGSVTFNSSTLNQTITTTGQDFYNLLFNGTGSWTSLTGPLTVSSDVFVQGGTFAIAGSSLTAIGSLRVTTPGTVNINNDVWVAGSSITNTGTITSLSTPTVTMSGAGTLGGSGSTTLPALTLATAQTTTLAGPVNILGAFNNPATHTLDASASNYGITISSNWANAGIYSARSSSVTFTGSVPNGTIATNVYAFYNLSVNGGTWQNITNTVTTSSSLYVSGGTLSVRGSSLTVTGGAYVSGTGILSVNNDVLISGGDLTNSGSGSITGLSTPTITLNGTGTLGGSATTTLPMILTLSGAGTTTLGGAIVLAGSATIATSHTLDVSASGNYQITVSSWFANNGTFNSRSGTVLVNSTATFTGTTSFYTFSSTVAGLTLTFQNGSTTTVTNSMTLTGASGNRIRLRSTVPGQNWSLNVSGSSSVSWVDAQDSDARSGTTIVPTNSVDSGNNHNWNFGAGIMRTWWGAVSTVWSNNSNWDSIAPGPTEKALIVSTATNMPTLTGNVAISTLTMVSASSVTLNGFTLTLSSFSNAGILVFKGNEQVVPAPDNILGSTVVYNATSGTVPVLSTWTYMNLQINGAGGKFLTTGNLTVNQALTITAGTFLHGNNTLTFAGTSGTNGIATNNNPLYNVIFNGAGGAWVLQDSMTIISSITLTAGTLNSNTGTATNGLAVGGEWINGGGVFISNSSSVTFTGSGTNLRLQSGDDPFYKMIFSGTGKWVTDTYALTVTSAVLVNSGTLQVAGGSSMTVVGNPYVASGATLDIEGDMGVGTTAIGGALNNAGTITSFSTATLTVTGTGNLGGSGTTTLPGLSLAGAGQTTTLASGITVKNTLTNGGSHTLDVSAGNFPLTVAGSWTNSGTYSARSGSVTFNASSANQTIAPNNSAFYNMVFNGAGSWTALAGPVTASSDVFVQNGTFAIAGSSLTATGSLRVTSPGTVNINNDVWIAGSSITNTGTITSLSTPTVTMSGAGTLGGTGSTTLPALTLAVAAKTTTLAGPVSLLGAFTNPANHTLDASASNYGITISSNWANTGIYTARSSSVTFTGSVPNGTIATNVYAFYNLSVNGGTWQNITNTVTASSSLYVSGGTLSVRGSSLTVTGGAYVSGTGILSVNNDALISGGDLTTNGSGSITGLSTPTITLNGTGTLGGSVTTTLPMILTLSGAGTTTLGGAVVLAGSATIATSHTLDVSASNYQITVSSWFANNGTFTARSGTVIVNSTATFTGSTSFYNFTATTPGITMTFQAGSTQSVTHTWTIAGATGNKISFRSTTGSPYTFNVSVSSFVSLVDVQNCIASSQTIYAGQASHDGGGNANWVFDFPPNAIATLLATALVTGDVRLNWTATLDPDDIPLGAGSQFVIEWATYTTVNWSTSTVGDTGQTGTSHFFISTSAVSAGDLEVVISTGLLANVTYYFQAWTKDPIGTWSLGFSNQTSTYPVAVLGLTATVPSYDFGTVNMGMTTVSTSAVTLTNTGNVSETYTLSVATTGASGLWGVSVATPTVLNHFVLFGGFNSAVAPGPTSFTNIDAITNATTASTASVYAIGQTGLNTSPGSTRDLWLRLDMPPSTTAIAQQQMTLTITVSTP